MNIPELGPSNETPQANHPTAPSFDGEITLVEIEVPKSKLTELIETIGQSAVAGYLSIKIAEEPTSPDSSLEHEKSKRMGGRQNKERIRLNTQLHPDMLHDIDQSIAIEGRDIDRSSFVREAFWWASSMPPKDLTEILRGDSEERYLHEVGETPKGQRGPKVRFTSRLTVMTQPKAVEAIDLIANNHGLNRSAVVRKVIAAYLEQTT